MKAAQAKNSDHFERTRWHSTCQCYRQASFLRQ